jgi:hypothetical protein
VKTGLQLSTILRRILRSPAAATLIGGALVCAGCGQPATEAPTASSDAPAAEADSHEGHSHEGHSHEGEEGDVGL